MNFPDTSRLKSAFISVAEAEERIRLAKNTLIELHYKSEEVDHSNFLLENIGRVAVPSDDAQDVLYARKQRAEEALSEAFRGVLFSGMTTNIDESFKCLSRATVFIKD